MSIGAPRRSWVARPRVPVVVAVLVLLLAPLLLLGRSDHAVQGGSLPVVGVQFHAMWDDYTDDEREQVLDRLVAAGVEWVRLDLSWAMLQPDSAATYSDWGVAFADRVIDMVERRGLKLLCMLWLTPRWANDGAGPRAAPTDPDDYARAARWVAQRYGDRVAALEVWNEPNHVGFLEGTDPVVYAELLRAAYKAIKEGSPDTTVVFGGTVYNDAEWIERAYEAGVGGFFDVMATHPYPAVGDLPPEAPDDGTMWRLTHLDAVREVMVRYGDEDKPLWFTEFGWSSHANPPGVRDWRRGVSRDDQAAYLVRTLRLVSNRYPYVTHVFWYRERDSARGDVHLDNFGLLDRELRPKPAFERLQETLRGGA